MGVPHFLVSLAHFCEIHGPSTILFLPHDATNIVTNFNEKPEDPPPAEGGDKDPAASLERSGSLLKAQKNADIDKQKSDALANCYISTKYPHSPRIYTSLMKLVMKCLSVEAVADPLKPLFYGDATNGFCLSKVFSIPDLHARGGERKYAFLVVCDSETHLLARWHFVLTYISEVISLLQGKVENVRESAKKESLDNERYLRRLKNMPRSLVQLAGDDEIFVRLHLSGVELLRDILC